MADHQVYQFVGNDYGQNYELKWSAAQVKKAKDYSELATALTHNFFSKLSVYDSNYAKAFQLFYGGYHDPALGQGFREIQTYGLPQVKRYQHPKPGDKLCLEVPNNRLERETIYGSVTMMTTAASMPFLLHAYDKFIKPDELYTFQQNKISDINEAIAFYQNLIFSYILGICPWGLDKADRHNNFTMSAILGAKWDDTAMTTYGDEKNNIGNLLKSICEDLKSEIDTEKNVRNINVYPVHEWWPHRITKDSFDATAKAGKYNKPTAALDENKLKKVYFDVEKIDPTQCAVAVARCLMHHIRIMTTELSFKNDPNFPGNLKKDDVKKYGSEDRIDGARSIKDGKLEDPNKDKYMATPMIVDKDELVIVMHPKLYNLLLDAKYASGYIKEGSYTGYVNDLLQYNILTIDTIPYGGIKLTTKSRYLLKDLYRKVLSDSLNQELYTQMSAHAGLVFGINRFKPCTYIKLTGLYIDPIVKGDMIGLTDGTELA